MWMFNPVLMPGPTTMGLRPVSLMMPVCTALNTGGTTDEMMQSSTVSRSTWKNSSILRISMPYWSEVLMWSVAMRASKTMAPSSMPPKTMLLFPISMARSIRFTSCLSIPAYAVWSWVRVTRRSALPMAATSTAAASASGMPLNATVVITRPKTASRATSLAAAYCWAKST